MHDEKAKKTGEIIFSVTQNITCELPQFLRDLCDFACKLKNYIILLQFVIFWLIDTRDFENSQILRTFKITNCTRGRAISYTNNSNNNNPLESNIDITIIR